MWNGVPKTCVHGHYNCDARAHHDCCPKCKDDRCPAFLCTWSGPARPGKLFRDKVSGGVFAHHSSGKYNGQPMAQCLSGTGPYYSIGAPFQSDLWDPMTGRFLGDQYESFEAPCVGGLGERYTPPLTT